MADLDTLGRAKIGADENLQVKRSSSFAFNQNTLNGFQAKGSAGRVKGIFVSAASATPTLKLWDSLTATGSPLIETFTPVAATMYNFGSDIEFGTGLFVTQAGCSDITVFYE